jgi:hypothetical protein
MLFTRSSPSSRASSASSAELNRHRRQQVVSTSFDKKSYMTYLKGCVLFPALSECAKGVT